MTATKPPTKPSVKIGLALSLACLVIALEVLARVTLGAFYMRRLKAEIDHRQEEALAKPSGLVAQGALSTDAFGQRDTMQSLVGPSLDDAMVVSSDGVVLVALDAGRVGRHLSEFPLYDAAWPGRAARGAFNERQTFGTNSYLVRVAPVASIGGEAPALFNLVRISTTGDLREFTSLRYRLIAGSFAAMVATTIALLLGVHYLVTRRLRRIASAMAQLTEGNYEITLDPPRLRDEIGFLQSGFDTMSERLRLAFGGLRQAMSEVEAAEKKYRVLVENAGEAILVVQDARIAFANARSHQMLDCAPGSLLGRPIEDFIQEDCRGMVLERHFRRMRGESPPTHYELGMTTSSGTLFWADLNVVLIDWKGHPATLNFCSDITERRRAAEERERMQAQLTQAQRMESVGRLAGGVAHDFNNMLQAIIGNAELAMMDIPPGNPARENIEEIQSSAKRSAELTRQLLTFARKQAVAPKSLDLNQVIGGMFKMLSRLIGEHIRLDWIPGEGLWPVRVDPSQLDQVLANLTVNARDAIRDSGRITIETRNVVLDHTELTLHPECPPGEYVMLSVTDTGQGMEPETLPHIFEPFFTTKEVGRGTGLGLATVFGVVKQNRGMIDVHSELGLGATFKIYFPRADAEPSREPQPRRLPAAGTETILLVEDEEPVLKLAWRALALQGYNVLPAPTPQAALELARDQDGPIDLLVTDVVMPGMNGKALRDQLKVNRPSLKCLFMSGYTADVIANHGILDHGVEFLQKPFTIATLTEKTRRVLDSPPQDQANG